jgi:hypothetical protein
MGSNKKQNLGAAIEAGDVAGAVAVGVGHKKDLWLSRSAWTTAALPFWQAMPIGKEKHGIFTRPRRFRGEL